MKEIIVFFRERRKPLLYFFLILVLFALATHYVGQDRIIHWVDSIGVRGPVLIITMRVLSIMFPIITGTPGYIAAGFLFGFWPAFLYNLIGNIIGMSVVFWIARTWGQDAIYKVMDRKSANKVFSLIHKIDDVRTFAISRTLGFFLDDVFNYAAGLSSIPFKYFFLISLVVASITSSYLIHAGVMLGM